MAWVTHTVPCLGDRWSSHRGERGREGGRERVRQRERCLDGLIDLMKAFSTYLSACWKPGRGSFASPFQFFMCFFFSRFLFWWQVVGGGHLLPSFQFTLEETEKPEAICFQKMNRRIKSVTLANLWCHFNALILNSEMEIHQYSPQHKIISQLFC